MRINGTHFVAQSGYTLKIFADRKYPKYARRIIEKKISNQEDLVIILTIEDRQYRAQFEYVHDLFGTDHYLIFSMERIYRNALGKYERYTINVDIFNDKIVMKSNEYSTRNFMSGSIPEFVHVFSKFADTLKQAIMAELKTIKNED